MAQTSNMITPNWNGGEMAIVAAPTTAPGPYVMDGDILILSLTTTDATGVVGIRGRHLRLDGEITPFQETMTFSGTGTQTEVIARLSAGWIIGFDVSRDSGTLTDGEVVASVHVGRNAGSLQQKLLCLASGDISNIRSLGLGAFTSAGSTSTATTTTVVTTAVSDPGAGNEFSVTVTAGQIWRIQAVRGVLTCSATVANREPVLTFDNGSAIINKAPYSTNTTAGTAKGFNWCNQGDSLAGVQSNNNVVSIPELYLDASYRIFSSTSNIQAGDTWTQVVISYLRIQ